MALGTPMWAYASLFWAHALVGACLLFAFAAALRLGDRLGAGGDFLWALAVGLAAGWATVTEYPAAPGSAMLALLALSQAWSRGRAVRWRVVAGVGVGAAICVAVLMAYLHAAFGGFRPSYSYYDPNAFSFMQQKGYLGLTYPHPDRLLKILFGCSRGLLFASPVVVGCSCGVVVVVEGENLLGGGAGRGGDRDLLFSVQCVVLLVEGGAVVRSAVRGGSIPLLCVGLAVAWGRATVLWRRVLIGLGVCSVFAGADGGVDEFAIIHAG
jgi:hypothetical protein